MNTRTAVALLSLLALAAPAWAGPSSDQAADAAVQLAEVYENAIVQVHCVVKLSAQGLPAGMNFGDQEQKVQVVGMVLDKKTALIAAPYTDPAKLMSSMNFNGQEITFKSEFSDVKIRLPNGEQVPGKIVLRDTDLNVAFIAPDKPLDKENARSIVEVPTDADPKAGLMAPVIGLGRLDKELNYALTVEIQRVRAVVSKPRLLHVTSLPAGAAVFTADGKLLGLNVIRNGADLETMMLSGGSVGTMVLPAAELRDLASQAKEELAE